MGSPKHIRRCTRPSTLASALGVCIFMVISMIYLGLSPESAGGNTIRNIRLPKYSTENPLPPPQPPQPPSSPTSPAPTIQPKDKVVSKGTILGTMGATGKMAKKHYRFNNVQLTSSDTLTFYYEPGFKPPRDHYVDTIFNNATRRILPTVTMIRDGITLQYLYLKIQYVPANEYQPNCTSWVKKPTYVMQVQHSENIWHAWNDGIMGAFQTLREQGHLPMVEIDKDGNVQEFLPGRGCWWMTEPATAQSEELWSTPCNPKLGAINTTKCKIGSDPWCKEGVFSYNTEHEPMLLLYRGTFMEPQWVHMYKAVSNNIRKWNSSIGKCFKELYLGKSNTLSYYMPLRRNRTVKSPELLDFSVELRANATEAFNKLITTAEHHAVRAPSDPVAQWTGYADPLFDEFRRGIGPEDIAKLERIRPSTDTAREVGKMTKKEVKELFRLWEWSRKTVAQLIEQGQNIRDRNSTAVGKETQKQQQQDTDVHHNDDYSINDTGNEDSDVAGTRPYSAGRDGSMGRKMKNWSMKRPVVTYMWRDSFKRSVLNAHHMLQYILMRYNVTLRMTTFEEPLPEVIKTMADTDVLIGMHGAGWTNALFLKQRAAALQLMPYGFVLPDGDIIRGSSYKEIILSRNCLYKEWVNTDPEMAFIRRKDIWSVNTRLGMNLSYSLHPSPEWEMPKDNRPGNHWIYQNTFINMQLMVPVIDELMRDAGIPIVHNDYPIERIRDGSDLTAEGT